MKPVCVEEIVGGQGECCFRERKPRGSLELEAASVSSRVMSTYVGSSGITILCSGCSPRCSLGWS